MAKSESAKIFASEGTLYWRLLADDEEVGGGRITVMRQKPLILISPSDKTLFRYKDESPKITLRWDEAEFASSYRLQISRTENFSSPFLDKTTGTPFASFETAGTGDGEFFWRVIPLYTNGNGGYTQESDIFSFSSEKIADITNSLIINQKAEEEARLAEIAQQEEEARLSEIARIEEEERVRQRERIEAEKKAQAEEEARLADTKKRQEQEKIRLAAEKQAQEQEQKRIEAQKRAQNQEKARLETEKLRQAQESARIAAVKKQNEQDRVRTEAEKRAQEQEQLRLESVKKQQEQERARLDAEQKQQEAEQQRARAEEARKQQELLQAQTRFAQGSPTLLSPSANLVMDSEYLKKNRTILFSWRAFSGADGYILTLTKVNGLNRTEIFSQNLTKPNFTLTNLSLLSAGTFEWQVQAYKNASSVSPALRSKNSTGAFKIDITPPQKIDASAPEGMYGN